MAIEINLFSFYTNIICPWKDTSVQSVINGSYKISRGLVNRLFRLSLPSPPPHPTPPCVYGCNEYHLFMCRPRRPYLVIKGRLRYEWRFSCLQIYRVQRTICVHSLTTEKREITEIKFAIFSLEMWKKNTELVRLKSINVSNFVNYHLNL
jgi:hypothetical protein